MALDLFVFVYLYMCVVVYMCIYIYMYVYVFIYMYVQSIYMYVDECMCTSLDVKTRFFS